MRRTRHHRTRNKVLFFAIAFVTAYVAVGIVYGFVALRSGLDAQLDATLTSEVVGFAKWIVTTGAAITITKTVKGEETKKESPEEFDYDC